MVAEGGRRSKILIVDDEVILQETLHVLIIDDFYDFLFASSGEEAITKAIDLQPDVILLDIMMPGMDGFTVCQQLKTNKLTQNIPIILVTALDNPDDISRGLESGADEFISKPPDRRVLKARVRSMLRIKHQYDDLEHSIQLRDDLTNLIVHDMRSPLNIIMGHGEMLLNAPHLSQGMINRVEKINEQADKLNKFIDEMLMIARMEQEKMVLNLAVNNINQIAARVVSEHHVIAQARNLKLTLENTAVQCTARVDEHLIARVIDNLLSNALKFSPSASEIKVRLDLVEKIGQLMVRLQIIDQGPGISKEFQANIFDKYKVIELKKAGVSQTGLGLFFCKLVVEAHGGSIWVENNSPVGSIFNIEIQAETI